MKGKNGLKIVLPLLFTTGIGFYFGTTAQAEYVATNINSASSAIVATDVPIATYVPVASATEQVKENTTGTWTDDHKFFFEDGTYAQNCQITIDGKIYFFDELGFQKTGWLKDKNNCYYYDPETYEMATGHITIDGNSFIFGYDGKLKSDWRLIDNNRVYFSEDGSLETGWLEYKDQFFYLDQNGIKQYGEVKVDGFTYMFDFTYGNQQLGFITFTDGSISYFNEDGSISTGWYTVDSSRYYAGTTGKCSIGWQTISNQRYYFNTNGSLKTGWIIDAGKKYYADNTGIIVSGWKKISGNTYYFDLNTKQMDTGFKIIDSKVYYFNANGIMQTGWQTISGGKYYLGTDGVRRTGFQAISGKTYYFNQSGVMKTDWQTINSKKYYFGTDGIMKTGWQTISSKKYYFGSDGVMKTGLQTINSKLYYFDANGVMLTNCIKDGYKIDSNGICTKLTASQLKAQNIITKIGTKLSDAFKYAYSMPYYGHNAYMPQDAATGTEWYANYGFTNYKGNCYVMAAVFYRLAEALGYKVRQVSGTVPLRAGGLGPHSWVEIDIDGTTYVCDPDFQHETGRNGYMIQYGQSGTWRYSSTRKYM